MSQFDDDFQTMAKGPLGCYADGPDGRLLGFLDRATEENWRISEFGRHQTRLDAHAVLMVGTAKLVNTVRQSFLVFPDQPNHAGKKTYRVLDIGYGDDMVITKLYLALVA